MSERGVRYFIFACLALLLVAWWRSDELPAPADIAPSLFAEPDQRPLDKLPFKAATGGVEYEIKPLFSYELNGLVVSRHDSETWWDSIHKEWNDALNVADLCVVWGNNLRHDMLGEMSFSSGQFVCYFQTSSPEAYAAFDPAALSNNHLLTTDPRTAKKIRAARVGDQIRLRGYLAEYAHHQGFDFKRGTSTVRTDTGNGACETVYVESFEILRQGNALWRRLIWIAAIGLALGIVAWFALPPVIHNDRE